MELQKFKQKNRRVMLVCFIVCIIFAVPSLCLLLLTYFLPSLSFPLLNEENTVEYAVTVKNVEKIEDGYLIYSDECSIAWFLAKELVVDIEAMDAVTAGETIYFRLMKGAEDMILEDPRITRWAVCTFRTETKDIATLASYNADLKKDEKGMKTTLGCVSGVGFFLSFIFLYKYIKQIKENKKIEDGQNKPSK